MLRRQLLRALQRRLLQHQRLQLGRQRRQLQHQRLQLGRQQARLQLGRRIIMRIMGTTIITVTHDDKMLTAADRVAWIRDGRLERVADREDVNIQVGRITQL